MSLLSPLTVAARAEATRIAPHRSQASDGILGDSAHATRKSGHNAGVMNEYSCPQATAVDITHDPAHGWDTHAYAERVRHRCATGGEWRVTYIISNGRIASGSSGWSWRAYGGTNPHTKHAHWSFSCAGSQNTAPLFGAPPAPAPPPVDWDAIVQVVLQTQVVTQQEDDAMYAARAKEGGATYAVACGLHVRRLDDGTERFVNGPYKLSIPTNEDLSRAWAYGMLRPIWRNDALEYLARPAEADLRVIPTVGVLDVSS